ncbi:IclR family transcriptional regulator [Dactylosporangium sp. NPDC049742]|uniref:IclR family transcriptional regulator n=1 Tax=Dactylosporangium sp. NPDC049742 TaxID=3154737 RepID=UPI0034263B1A
MSRGAVAMSEEYRVPAIERAVRVLRLLAARDSMSLAQTVEATGMNKSTTYYILRTLLAENLVQYDDAGQRYQLGPALVELGAAAANQMNDVSIAKRSLAELLEQMNVTIVLYRRISLTEIILADKLERPHRVRITLQVGTPVPIQGGSFGRVFLAYDQPSQVNAALATGLQLFTSKSVTRKEIFLRDLERVREQGFAVDHEGYALGVSTVAAPVFGPDGRIRLVAAAVGFTSEMDEQRSALYGRLLRECCERITKMLAGRTELVGQDESWAGHQPLKDREYRT